MLYACMYLYLSPLTHGGAWVPVPGHAPERWPASVHQSQGASAACPPGDAGPRPASSCVQGGRALARSIEIQYMHMLGASPSASPSPSASASASASL